jgi:hypothetical protein
MQATGLQGVRHQHMILVIKDLRCWFNIYNGFKRQVRMIFTFTIMGSLYHTTVWLTKPEQDQLDAQPIYSARLCCHLHFMHYTLQTVEHRLQLVCYTTPCAAVTGSSICRAPVYQTCSLHMRQLLSVQWVNRRHETYSVQPPGHRLNDPGMNAWQARAVALIDAVQTGYGAHQPLYSKGSGGLLPCRLSSSQGINFTDHLHRVPRLRMLDLHCYCPYGTSWYAEEQLYLYFNSIIIIIIIIIFNVPTAAFKAYCAFWVRRSNFRQQASPRMSSCESTQRQKVKLWARNVREFCLNAKLHVTFRDLLHAVKLWHGTDGFTSPPKEGMLRIFSP